MRRLLLVTAAAAPALLAAGNATDVAADAGERAYQKCYSCHSLTGAETLEGPSLAGIVGRPVAAENGFDYSAALKRFAKQHPVWTEDLLDRLIADPESFVPGTAMAFAGMHDPGERAALLSYLRSESKRR